MSTLPEHRADVAPAADFIAGALDYGHYDVQPPGPLEEWHSPPFEPTIRNGNLDARGAADNIGQMYMHIKAAEALRKIFGRPTVCIRSGGSVPIFGDVDRHLGIPTVMMGMGLPDDGLHSPNEKFRLENFYTGIRAVASFFERYAQAV